MVKKQDKHTQIEKFREAARELETDDSEEAFARIVKKIAKAPAAKDRGKGKENGDKV